MEIILPQMTIQKCDVCNKPTEHLTDSNNTIRCYECFTRSISDRVQLMNWHYENELEDTSRENVCNCFMFHNVPMMCIYCAKLQKQIDKKLESSSGIPGNAEMLNIE